MCKACSASPLKSTFMAVTILTTDTVFTVTQATFKSLHVEFQNVLRGSLKGR